MDKERQYRSLFAQCQRSGSICDPIQARTLVLPEARVRKYVLERNFQRTEKKMRYCRVANGWLTQSSVISHSIFPALGPLAKGRSNCHFQGAFENKKSLIRTILATKLQCIQYRTCQWYQTENQVPTPRTTEVDIDYAERVDNATSSRRFVLTTHRESRDADSRSFRTGSRCQNTEK